MAYFPQPWAGGLTNASGATSVNVLPIVPFAVRPDTAYGLTTPVWWSVLPDNPEPIAGPVGGTMMAAPYGYANEGAVNGRGAYYSYVMGLANLVAYWRFDETWRDTAYDSGPNQLHGTYQPTGNYTLASTGSLSENADEKAVTLDGVSGFVEVPHNAVLSFGTNGPLTGLFAVKKTSTGTKDEMTSKGASNYEWLFSDAALTGGADKMQMWNGAAQLARETNANTDTTNFHLYAVTYAGSTTAKIFKDGADVTGATGAGTITDNTSALRMGITSTGTNPAAAVFDEFALFNRVLTNAEIAQAYIVWSATVTAKGLQNYDITDDLAET